MSTVLLGETWPLEMPPTVKSVAISLADQANDTGVCWPAVGSISIRTNLDPRTVRRAVSFLESNHYLRVERRTGHSSYYHLCPPQYRQPVTPVRESPLSESQAVLTQRQGSPDTQSPTPDTPPAITITNRHRTIKEPSRALIEIPEWLPVELWSDFKQARKKLRAPMTPRAEELALRKLAALRTDGNDPVKVIEQSLEYGWKGLFPLGDRKHETHRKLSAVERTRLATRQRDAEIDARVRAEENKRAMAADGGDIRPQVVEPVR